MAFKWSLKGRDRTVAVDSPKPSRPPPRRLKWTAELVSAFWDGVAQSPGMESLSFAKTSGPALIEFMKPWVKDGARCLDFGGGSGEFVRQMVNSGLSAALYEPSSGRTALALPGLSGHPLFLGKVTPDDKQTFDFVICAEVIEHVLEQDFDSFMRSLIGSVSSGGRLMVTTPLDEDLAQGDCYCPTCNQLFHRWQHQRSWKMLELEALMRRWGLSTVWLGQMSFGDPGVMREYHRWRALGEEANWGRVDGYPSLGAGGNLVYIGEKP